MVTVEWIPAACARSRPCEVQATKLRTRIQCHRLEKPSEVPSLPARIRLRDLLWERHTTNMAHQKHPAAHIVSYETLPDTAGWLNPTRKKFEPRAPHQYHANHTGIPKVRTVVPCRADAGYDLRNMIRHCLAASETAYYQPKYPNLLLESQGYLLLDSI